MVIFFSGAESNYFAVDIDNQPDTSTIEKLTWVFSGASFVTDTIVEGTFVGPRKEMITPWSTNAVEITQNMGITGIKRIELFLKTNEATPQYDSMLQRVYSKLDQDIFKINKQPDPILEIDDIAGYNQSEGLALSSDEVKYLNDLSKKLGRKLTDSEIFGFSQVNSEHCRHKIFNGTFIIDGEEKDKSLFQLIKLTTQQNRNDVISAYRDNCAFLQGPVIDQFAPKTQDKPDFFELKSIDSMLSLKAETHNFPTTVEPFNGAATGSGGEIRDRLAGGKASLPIAGTAVYMTAYPRLDADRPWVINSPERKWLYQTPSQILIKASNGASDFGNKYGQPLICGSVLTFEYLDNSISLGFDKVIMMAGGVGFGNAKHCEKGTPSKGDKVVLLGGDNYRIGMGGGAVSSVATGEYENKIELNAVQRSNPEMQKRVANAIRALAESDINPVISIHDHGAGGHLNCLSELVEATGGKIDMSKLPIGDPTLSAKEIVGNESQERMGLVMRAEHVDGLKRIAERERAPMYVIGETTGDHQFTFEDAQGNKPLDLSLEDMFGNPPKTILKDTTKPTGFSELTYDSQLIEKYIEQVLQLEAVACKDWLTNKVDRSVTGKIAKQQTAGRIQLPLNNLGVTALDFSSHKGMATSIGHAPVPAIIDAAAGSILSITESLTNIIWAPLKNGIKSVSLSANWMWPCKNAGEDSRLYQAVQAASDFAIALGINIPTGKDSLSMTQKYPDGKQVLAPGTVIISAMAEVSDIRKVVEPVLRKDVDTEIIYIPLSEGDFELGGSAFAQVLNQMGTRVNTIEKPEYLLKVFAAIQSLIEAGKILAGHDVSTGGLVTTLLEMCFADENLGMKLDLSPVNCPDTNKVLFSERPALVIQASKQVLSDIQQQGIWAVSLGKPQGTGILDVTNGTSTYHLEVAQLRDTWFKTSYLLDKKQTKGDRAESRFKHYKEHVQKYAFPSEYTNQLSAFDVTRVKKNTHGVKAAIIREKGVNGDREMAYSMFLAGMDVKDVHMTDLIQGRETLEDVQMIVFVGGFSNSDVLGSAKGWAGAFLYNPKAKEALDKFYARPDTLSLGVCNGCQLMVELGLLGEYNRNTKPTMHHNESGKFESAFLSVDIPENKSIMLASMAGSKLGIWVAHGEGKFHLPASEDTYPVALKYSYQQYPANPNGSDYNVAGICSADGRHLAMMPHLERAIFPWNWAYYPEEKQIDEVSPWIEAFINARKWMEQRLK